MGHMDCQTRRKKRSALLLRVPSYSRWRIQHGSCSWLSHASVGYFDAPQTFFHLPHHSGMIVRRQPSRELGPCFMSCFWMDLIVFARCFASRLSLPNCRHCFVKERFHSGYLGRMASALLPRILLENEHEYMFCSSSFSSLRPFIT